MAKRGRYCEQCGQRVYAVQNAEGERFLITSPTYDGRGGKRKCPKGRWAHG